jgi:hypothetical protein
MYCTHCGRPAAALVWINGMGYHEECLRGPGWTPQGYQSSPQPMWFGLTEARVRQIVREELDARKEKQ